MSAARKINGLLERLTFFNKVSTAQNDNNFLIKIPDADALQHLFWRRYGLISETVSTRKLGNLAPTYTVRFYRCFNDGKGKTEKKYYDTAQSTSLSYAILIAGLRSIKKLFPRIFIKPPTGRNDTDGTPGISVSEVPCEFRNGVKSKTASEKI